ncbi:MAG: selenium cofactor biosynthesis protein YqeC [Acidobacteriota bacterium]|jgi:probable selenium-dependent hydroxylase accessory protein YqeC
MKYKNIFLTESELGNMIHMDKDFPLFSRHFGFEVHSLVNFVGGGGKTALIHKLMKEFIGQGHVLYTTTTRIHPPDSSEELVVISSDNLMLSKMLIGQVALKSTERNYKIVVTQHFMEPDLLKGVPANFLESIERDRFIIFLNEADGSARFSIKLPREGEPVLMEHAEYLVPVIGIDCLYKPSGPDTLFRCESLSEQFSIQKGEIITPELASRVLMHPKGVCKDWGEGMVIIPFINKVDSPQLDPDARLLASHILNSANFPVSHVIYGSVQHGRINSISDKSQD